MDEVQTTDTAARPQGFDRFLFFSSQKVFILTGTAPVVNFLVAIKEYSQIVKKFAVAAILVAFAKD